MLKCWIAGNLKIFTSRLFEDYGFRLARTQQFARTRKFATLYSAATAPYLQHGGGNYHRQNGVTVTLRNRRPGQVGWIFPSCWRRETHWQGTDDRVAPRPWRHSSVASRFHCDWSCLHPEYDTTRSHLKQTRMQPTTPNHYEAMRQWQRRVVKKRRNNIVSCEFVIELMLSSTVAHALV